ncbi:uncharacterized protein LOC110913183 [Helianthus annuus]|uniref:uncharacterized protein LOC110913183 n=1 Tax=Helianthus annuus TaxID=4232 RepID=UPI0016531CB5|nr:uncharacterized protein LOC110913183 [Helianthus annuus]
MANEVGCKPDTTPFKYLGLNVGANMNRIINWHPVYEIFRACLSKWKAKLLSIGGRVVLIKSVMESLPNYYFSLYKAPNKVITNLEAMIKRFLWGGSIEERKMHWVAWDRVSCHKKEGGLGLKKLKEINTTLLIKWDGGTKRKTIVFGRELLMRSILVGWGGSVSFSRKASMGFGTISRSYLLIPRLGIFLFGTLSKLLAILVDVRVTSEADRWRWTSDSSGSFSVKSVKKLLYEAVDTENRYILDWCKWAAAKVNIHSWRMEMEKIPTGVALKYRNVQIGDPLCPLCGSNEESVERIFIACQVASVIWNGVSSWCKIPNIFAFSIRDLLRIHKEISASECKKEAVQSIIMIGCWSLWRARNNLIFSNKEIKIDRIMS